MSEHIKALTFQEQLSRACSWYEANKDKVDVREASLRFGLTVDELLAEYYSRHGESSGTIR